MFHYVLLDIASDRHHLLKGLKPGVGDAVDDPVGVALYGGMVLRVNDYRNSDVVVKPVAHLGIHTIENFLLLNAEPTFVPYIQLNGLARGWDSQDHLESTVDLDIHDANILFSIILHLCVLFYFF